MALLPKVRIFERARRKFLPNSKPSRIPLNESSSLGSSSLDPGTWVILLLPLIDSFVRSRISGPRFNSIHSHSERTTTTKEIAPTATTRVNREPPGSWVVCCRHSPRTKWDSCWVRSVGVVCVGFLFRRRSKNSGCGDRRISWYGGVFGYNSFLFIEHICFVQGHPRIFMGKA